MTIFKRNAVLVLLVAVLCLRSHADSPVSTLEGLVAQWMELRSAVAGERRDWQAQKQHLESEIALLERERSMLGEYLADADSELVPLKQGQANLETRRANLQSILTAIEPAVALAEADLRQWRVIIPAHIGAPLQEAFERLPADTIEAGKRAVTRRLQLVIALYTEIENLQHGYHSGKEILVTGTDQRAEVDVLYVGLSRAYALSPDGDWAAVGVPGRDGWSWTTTPRIAPAVRKALRVLRREEVAGLVALPVSLSAAELAPPGQESGK